MDIPSDQEINNRYKSIYSIDHFEVKYSPKGTVAIYWRDELFYRLLYGWNKQRIKAGYKPLTIKRLACAINKNPFLKDNGELELLIKECENKGNYKKAHYILFK